MAHLVTRYVTATGSGFLVGTADKRNDDSILVTASKMPYLASYVLLLVGMMMASSFMPQSTTIRFHEAWFRWYNRRPDGGHVIEPLAPPDQGILKCVDGPPKDSPVS